MMLDLSLNGSRVGLIVDTLIMTFQIMQCSQEGKDTHFVGNIEEHTDSNNNSSQYASLGVFCCHYNVCHSILLGE